MDARRSALVAATDQLIADHRIDDETWQQLAEHLDEKQLVEVVFVAGTYTCLAMAFNSFGLQLDPGAEAELPTTPRLTQSANRAGNELLFLRDR